MKAKNNLLDGVQSAAIRHSAEVKSLSAMTQDKNLSIIDRIESFEDIISLEIGNTNQTRARTLERESDIRQLYIKYEGNNPSGTQKDRIAFAQVLDALNDGMGINAVCRMFKVSKNTVYAWLDQENNNGLTYLRL